ncbi:MULTISPECIES: hypothetical protein [unclassified Enterococcus]|uniref:hypothetical protein n=1 Tax=unclassified Enterococcus TaxID=2608891 RepID=UPI0019054C56|nr:MULTISPECIES: hypothetical protein [unclassified Enterococcus]MBK0039278.1 hypothetical protein [Enterococcus sp. S52]MBK0071949.1 hypothetical protein [Enterococcus sp. S53]MBK0142540.1 hypothetical protein [Enterococcus sp. S76]MBK0145693.1 hypothetical protein [Enterococcus sp. S77]
MDEEKIFDKRWQLASTEQKARYNNLISSYPTIDWTFKEKKYLLWLCQLDIDTFKTFEMILDKIKRSNEKRANL